MNQEPERIQKSILNYVYCSTNLPVFCCCKWLYLPYMRIPLEYVLFLVSALLAFSFRTMFYPFLLTIRALTEKNGNFSAAVVIAVCCHISHTSNETM